MDRVLLKNMAFYGYHGVLPEEKKLGQKFFVDLELYYDIKKACVSDDIKDTLDYVKVYDECKNIVENNIFDLIETLAEEISNRMFEKFSIVTKTVVRVRKPEAPFKGHLDYVEVQIGREREDRRG